MTNWGGGWQKFDNSWANTLLTVTNPNPAQGNCTISATLWQSWYGFNPTTAATQVLCIGANTSANWPSYSELHYEGVVLTGYDGTNGSFDLGTNCYSINGTDDFCAGPAANLYPPNTVYIQLANGVNSPTYTRTIALGATYTDFQIRARGYRGGGGGGGFGGNEGVQWKTGAIYIR